MYICRLSREMNSLKNNILLHAQERFLMHGFKSVTMDELASELGMSKKTLYSHYKNKEALIEAVAMNIYHTICDKIDGICKHTDNPIQELYDVKKMVMTTLKGDKSSPIFQLQKYYPEIHKKIQRNQFDFMQECIHNNLQRGISQGLYRTNLDLDFVSRIYFIGMQGIKDQEIFPMETFPVMELYSMYLEYHLRGIVTPSGRKILNNIINSNHD